MSIFRPRGSEYSQEWFWGVLRHYAPLYMHVAVASFMVNLLALAMPLFIMNVYDRVVPNNAFESLWVLAVGVVLALLLDMGLRVARTRFVDMAGRNADVILLGRFMDALLDTRLDALPATSMGGLAASVRQFEFVREFLGSATLITLLDLPFLLLFLALICLLGGPLVFIPLLGIPCLALLASAIQRLFRHSAEQQLRHMVNKQALLGELATGFETIRAARLERRLLARWDKVVDDAAQSSAEARQLGALTGSAMLFFSSLLTVGIMLGGVYRIAEGAMSMGGLIACVILLGRCTVPMSGLVSLLSSLHKTRLALSQMSRILALPRENPLPETPPGVVPSGIGGHDVALSADAQEKPAPPTALSSSQVSPQDVTEQALGVVPAHAGSSIIPVTDVQALPVDIRLERVGFRYPGQDALTLALRDITLHFRRGERVAVLGATGSGKSSLARLCAGLYLPTEGRVLLGNVELHRLPMRTVRRNLGFLPQAVHLFSGTVRDNIAMAWPGEGAPDEDAVLVAAELAGVMDFAREHPLGLDMPISEGGHGLSGGQAQAVALARALLGNPQTLILDEPTSNLDMAAEERLRQRLLPFVQGRTLLLLTHRVSMLHLVNRVVVLNRGTVIKDGSVQEVLKQS